MSTDGPVEWTVVEPGELDVPTLYELLMLRSAVFVVEQECAYQDPDGRDLVPGTRHVLGRRGDELVAYARVLPATEEETNAALTKQLSVLRAQLERDNAAEQAAEWERSRACWSAMGRALAMDDAETAGGAETSACG